MTWIQTYRGHAFSLEPGGERIYDLEDIAHALGNLCRFTGHSRRFYSVAEHSLLVASTAWAAMYAASDIAQSLTRSNIARRLGLFHDAAEAYLGDVSRPLKRMPGMEAYRELEALIESEIVARFDLSTDTAIVEAVKRADNELLAAERDQVFLDSVRPKDWEWLPEPAPVSIEFLPPNVAATRWLNAAKQTLKGIP